MTKIQISRLVLLLALTICSLVWVQGKLLWLLFFLLFLFFVAVDFFKVHLAPADAAAQAKTSVPLERGVIGHFVDDGEKVFGAYIYLRGWKVLIDLREDRLVNERIDQARLLIGRDKELETSLDFFLELHPEFSGRQIACIGLHSTTVSKGEVFWDPEGHSSLDDFTFRK